MQKMTAAVFRQTPMWFRQFLWKNRNRIGWRIYRSMLDSFTSVPVSGIDLELPRSREGIVEELIVFGVHEPIGTDAYARIIDPGDVVLDIGMNIGYYCAVASSRIGARGAIFGFEPDPDAFACAVQNAAKLGVPFEAKQGAVAESSGEVTFHRSNVLNWGSLCQSDTLSQTESITVEGHSVDDFCKKYNVRPNVIRMDIEGGELGAIAGAVDTLRSCVPKLFMEVHPWLLGRAATYELLQKLIDAGYDKAIRIDRAIDNPWDRYKEYGAMTSLTSLNELQTLNEHGELEQCFSILLGVAIEAEFFSMQN